MSTDVAELSTSQHEPTPPGNPSLWGRIKAAAAPVVAFLALVIKLKSVLFLGSMAVSIAAYAQLWGWQFAVAFVVMLLVHELGHVIALWMRGIRASTLVFVPLLGAFTSWAPKAERDAYQEAETSLAGPLLGTIGALYVGAYAHSTGSQLARAIGFTALLLNLINLIPLLPLDGGRLADVVYPWVWAVLGVGLIGYVVVRPQPVVIVILLLVGYELYTHLRKPASEIPVVSPRHRLGLSLAYLSLIVVIVIGMHATYTARTLR